MVFWGLVPLIAIRVSLYSRPIAWTIGILSVVSFFIVPFLILRILKLDITYNGVTVKVKSISGEREIFVDKIKSIKYDVDTGFRSNFNFIYMTINLLNDDPVEMTAEVSQEKMGKVLKGDRDCVPILVMYDDIVSRYPEKEIKE